MQNILSLAAIALLLFTIQLAARYHRSSRLKRFFRQGMEFYKQNNHESALKAFRKCVKIAPEWLHARTLMSISLAGTGKTQEALREVEMIKALQPREAETWTLIVTFFLLSMPHEEAGLFGALEKLAELDPVAARAIISQPVFNRYRTFPRLHSLQDILSESS